MKQLLFAIILFVFVPASFAQKTNPNYDAELAKKFNADDYGMKKFIFVILKTGSQKSTDKKFRDDCFASHMKSTNKLIKERKMVIAGPMFKNDNNYRGIFILAVDTKDKAKELLKNDKAISENFLEAIYYDWYGSAALAEYLKTADKIWKVGF